METHVNEQSVLGELRQQALVALLDHPLCTEAEQLRANHFAHEYEDIARLTRWATSVRVQIARHEAEAARCHQIMSATLPHLCAPSFGSHYPRLPRLRPTWVVCTPLLDGANHRAGTFDRLAASRFQPADSLTLADLLSRPRR